MVFQNYALYPYLNVFENIAFGLRARKFAEAEIDAGSTAPPRCSASAICSSACRASFPAASASGSRSAAAIVRDARLFLFDEPLSNLDAQLRDGMRAEIKRLHQELGKTTIYVTHDQIEAMTLADRIVLLQGRRDRAAGRAARAVRASGHPVRRRLPRLAADELRSLPARRTAAACALRRRRALPLPPAKAARLDAWRGRAMTLGIRPEHFSRARRRRRRPGQVPLRVTIDLVQPTGTRTYASSSSAGPRSPPSCPPTPSSAPAPSSISWPTSTAPS